MIFKVIKGVTMELRVLKYFLTVVREESLTKAAEVLHITQPTLSRQLSGLEEEMGVRLFHRGARKIKLTDDGILLQRRAEEILELVEKTKQDFAGRDESVAGTVSIGCGDLGASLLLPELFEAFRRKYPSVVFNIYTASAEHIKERMDRGLTDIGLLLEPVSMEKYEFIRLRKPEQWVVAMNPQCPLAKKEYITPAELKDYPLVLPVRPSVQSELTAWFGEDVSKLNIVFTANLPSAYAPVVYNGLACAPTILGTVSFWDEKKIVYRPLHPKLTASSVLAWKKEKPFGVAATKFIEFSKQVLPFFES